MNMNIKYLIGAVIAAAVTVGMTMIPAQAGQDGLAGAPYKTAPALSNGVWANGKPTTIAAQKGKVVILAFWTHQCINCKRTIPFWNDWAKKYAGTNVTVLSVHTPEIPEERKIENVRRFVQNKGITFPVVTDNDFASWNAYKIDAWPTTVLIDKQGRIRGRWEGELDYDNSGQYRTVEQAIEALRKEEK